MNEPSQKLFVLELDIFEPENNFKIVRDYYRTTNRKELVNLAQNTECDILGLRFGISSLSDVPVAVQILKEVQPLVDKPIMIRGCGNDGIDKVLLPELIKFLPRESIVACVNETTFRDIVPSVVSGWHILVLRSPIDINLCKELNILSADLGLSLDKIFIDTDIGGLGYGLEYGYSIMEKVKLEGLNGDEYLSMPIISFVCEESLKTKEAKVDDESALMIEISSASAVLAGGADIVVVNHPKTLETLRRLV